MAGEASDGILPTGKRRGGYVRKRDAYLVRERDRRRNTQELMNQMMLPRRRGEQPGPAAPGARAAARRHGGAGGVAMDSDDVDGGDGNEEGDTGSEMSTMHTGGDQALPVLPGFEDHPAFAKVKDAGAGLLKGRVEKAGSRAARSRSGRRMSEETKAMYLRKAEAAQDREGECCGVGV